MPLKIRVLPGESLKSKKREVLFLSGIFLFFLFFLMREWVHPEEAFSLILSDVPTLEVFLSGILHPSTEPSLPFYFVLLKIIRWLPSGSLLLARILSLSAGAVTVLFVYRIVEKVFHRRAAIYSAFLLVFNPVFLGVIMEATVYSVAVCITVLHLYFLLLFLRDHQRAGFIGFVLTGIAGVYTHYYFWAFVLADILILIRHLYFLRFISMKAKTKTFFLLGGIGLILLSAIPGLPFFILQMKEGLRWIQWEPVTWRSFSDIFSYFFSSRFGVSLNPFVPSGWTGGISLILIIAALVSFRKFRLWRIWIPAIFFFVPLVSVFLFSWISGLFFNFRYYSLFLPFICILLGISIALIRTKNISIAVIALLLISILPSSITVLWKRQSGLAGDAVELINKNDPSLIMTFDYRAFLTMHYYLQERSHVIFVDQEEKYDGFRGLLSEKIYLPEELESEYYPGDLAWMITTPQSDNQGKLLMKHFFEMDREILEWIFAYPDNWFKLKIYRIN